MVFLLVEKHCQLHLLRWLVEREHLVQPMVAVVAQELVVQVTTRQAQMVVLEEQVLMQPTTTATPHTVSVVVEEEVLVEGLLVQGFRVEEMVL
jgi:hypothetical protein